jgi:hypothetical protein
MLVQLRLHDKSCSHAQNQTLHLAFHAPEIRQICAVNAVQASINDVSLAAGADG